MWSVQDRLGFRRIPKNLNEPTLSSEKTEVLTGGRWSFKRWLRVEKEVHVHILRLRTVDMKELGR